MVSCRKDWVVLMASLLLVAHSQRGRGVGMCWDYYLTTVPYLIEKNKSKRKSQARQQRRRDRHSPII